MLSLGAVDVDGRWKTMKSTIRWDLRRWMRMPMNWLFCFFDNLVIFWRQLWKFCNFKILSNETNIVPIWKILLLPKTNFKIESLDNIAVQVSHPSRFHHIPRQPWRNCEIRKTTVSKSMWSNKKCTGIIYGKSQK